MQGRVFLGRYETISQIGEGGMGLVYLARQLDLDRKVVVKVMHDHIAADPTFRERFQREKELMARFQHPYAVTLYDADAQGSCIVMEYIKGVTLDVVLKNNRRLDAVRAGRIVQQLCEVLQAAHEEGIVHRDLKPANLMIVHPDTPYELIKVMDFGLATLLGPASRARVTTHEFAVGTPGYMCPEQARGEDPDPRGDLYSVGVILFELLTGRLPFTDKPTMEILLAHAIEPPPSFADIGCVGLVPPAIERVVQSCLAKEPAQRPQQGRELLQRYQEALSCLTPSALSHVTPRPAFPRVRPPRMRTIRPQPAPVHIPEPLPEPPESPPLSPPPVAVPEPVVVKSPVPRDSSLYVDQTAVIHHLEAWMPEKIAAYKMRGFIQDAGGELIESVPGRITVRLGGKGCVYTPPTRGLSWLGIGRRQHIEVELRLNRADGGRENQLRITVIFRSPGLDLNLDVAWRSLCTQIFCDLRAYLMGQTGLSDC